MNKERLARSLPGIPALLVLLVATLVYVVVVILYISEVLVPAGDNLNLWTLAQIGLLTLVGVVIGIGYAGLTPVNPNEARALVLFGHYNGSLRSQGFHWVNPFTQRRKISVRVRNFETSKLKVNDHDGNPIEIAAVVVWKVTDTAEALFEVDDYENFVQVQAESALRNLATSHPYDTHREDEIALRANQAEIADQLRTQIQDRLEQAGVKVHRGPDQPPRLRPGDRQRDAPAPAGEGGHRGSHADRRGRRGHGRDGAGAALGQERRGAGRGAQGADGQQPAGGPVLGARDAAGGQRRDPLRVAGRHAARTSLPKQEPTMAERKPFLLRLDPETFAALQRWAADDLRSMNGQVEFLLRRALQDTGRLPETKAARATAEPSPPDRQAI